MGVGCHSERIKLGGEKSSRLRINFLFLVLISTSLNHVTYNQPIDVGCTCKAWGLKEFTTVNAGSFCIKLT